MWLLVSQHKNRMFLHTNTVRRWLLRAKHEGLGQWRCHFTVILTSAKHSKLTLVFIASTNVHFISFHSHSIHLCIYDHSRSIVRAMNSTSGVGRTYDCVSLNWSKEINLDIRKVSSTPWMKKQLYEVEIVRKAVEYFIGHKFAVNCFVKLMMSEPKSKIRFCIVYSFLFCFYMYSLALIHWLRL